MHTGRKDGVAITKRWRQDFHSDDVTDLATNYALIATADVPAVYLQQFWKIVRKVPDTKDTILKSICRTSLPSRYWISFMHRVGYQGVVDKYPHFTKLIIADLMKKFPSIPPRFEEDYHSINDDIPLVSVYTTGNVTVRRMLIPDAFLTNEIRATDDYKEYEIVFVNVAVPMNQPQPVVSTQGTHKVRIEPGSHKEHSEFVDDDDNNEEKKNKKEGDVMGSLEIRTEKMQIPIPTTPRSPRINVSSNKNIAQELTDIVSISTPTTSKDSHKKRRISSKYSHLPGALHRMCKRQGNMIRAMEGKCVTTDEFWKVHKKFDQVLHEIVAQLAERATYDFIENNLKPCIAETIIEDHDAFLSEVPNLISQEFNAYASNIIEELFKNYVQTNMKSNIQDQANDPTLWDVLKRKFEKPSTSKTSCKEDDFYSHHDDHQEDDSPPEGEKRVKRQKASKSSKFLRGYSLKRSAKDFITYVSKQQQQQEWDAWEEETVIDEDERVPTIFDRARIEATLNDMLSNQFKNAEEYAYHLEQVTNFMKNQIVWESRQKDIRRPVPKPLVFFRPQRNSNEPPRKDEKWVMYLVEIVKFCDATLEKVLKEVKLKIFLSKPWKKPPLLGELDHDIMRAFDREITKQLRHREQMRRWESFVNGRPILLTMKHLKKEIDRPKALDFADSGNVNNGKAIRELDEFCRVSFRHEDRIDLCRAQLPYYFIGENFPDIPFSHIALPTKIECVGSIVDFKKLGMYIITRP
ncbi:hypothetical protein Tco_0837895 [Tanacetum coccineum]